MLEPVRILHVVVNMNRGGAETLLMNLYRNLDRSMVQFDFLTSRAGVFDEEILAMGGRIHRIPYISESGHFKYIRALDEFFSSHKEYTIVHSHMDKMSGFVVRSAGKVGIPVRIAHSHNTKSEGGRATRLYKWYAGKQIPSLATDYLACSNEAGNWLFPNKSSEVHVLHNGIESQQFVFRPEIRNQIRKELNINEETYVVGHVGRFVHQKNHQYLIERFADFESANKNSVLLLAGDGPLRSELESQVHNLGITDKVKFLGVRSDINCLLQAFDVFVFPSHHEGLPLVLIEAQGSGLPCIISDRISHEVDMKLGLVKHLPHRDPEQWIERMTELSQKRPSRLIPADALSKQGYDIKELTEWLQKFYFSRMR